MSVLVSSTTENNGDNIRESQTIKVTFRNFQQLPNERGKKVSSSPLKCHGETFRIDLYPGGDKDSADGYMAWYLFCESAQKNCYDVLIDLRMCANRRGFGSRTNCCLGKSRGERWSDCYLREAVQYDHDGGTLTIEAVIQLCSKPDRIWLPTSKLDKVMLEYLESAKTTGDITFRIGESDFAAHRGLLELRIPALAALGGESLESPVTIEGINPWAFDTLLRFAYANALPPLEDMSSDDANMLLDAADKWQCTDLKLYAEAAIVGYGINVDTAADLILKAHSMTCALLKEKAMEFYAKNAPAIMKTTGWEKIVESNEILRELLELTMSDPTTSETQEENGAMNYERMSVSSLRRRLDKEGQGVDGSKRMLLMRLQEVDLAKASATDNDSDENAGGGTDTEDIDA